MGAPGVALLCRRGHLYHWIDDDLVDWDEDLCREFGWAEHDGCPCGEKSVVKLNHYGDISDCLNSPLKKTGAETLRWRERIPDAVDRDGNPLTIAAYRDKELTLPVYDVSSLEFPVPVREG